MNLKLSNPTSPEPLANWLKHIKKVSGRSLKPDWSEVIQPFRVNWTLYGQYLEARAVLMGAKNEFDNL